MAVLLKRYFHLFRWVVLPAVFLVSSFQVVLVQPPTVTLSVSQTLQGAAGDTVEVPVMLDRGGNDIAALGAAIKATNNLLAFIDFATGPIIPGPLFNVNAPTLDSVRVGFFDAGGGPIAQDGLLVTLRFYIDSNAVVGSISQLHFSELSASDPNFLNLTVVGSSGILAILPQPGDIHGMKWNDLDSNGVKDPGEQGLAGWQIILADSTGTIDTTITGSDGEYWFMRLAPGTYTVSEVLQPNWAQTYPRSPGIHTVDLNPGQVADSINFGNDMIVSVGWEDGLPQEFELSQNYPNPFNPSTDIQFALPKESRVKVEIFNLLGERIVTLVNETRQAGYYSEQFDATGLSSGLYFYRLQAVDLSSGTGQNFVSTKKLVVLK